jgi:hypothetical protein
MYDAMVSVLPSSVVRVCLCMIQLSREEGLDPISYATQSVAFLTSLTLGREFPLTYGLDCFATTGIGTVYPSGAPEFIPGLMWGSCSSIFSFVCMVCRSFFVLLSFFLWSLCLLSCFDLLIRIPYLVSLSSFCSRILKVDCCS